MANTRSLLEQRFPLAVVLGSLMLVAQPLAPNASADPAPLEKFGWTVNGTADTATQIGDVLYVGGRFTRVSPFDAVLGSFYDLSAITGEPAGVLPVVDGQIFAVEPDGAGGYYVGGDFTTVAGLPRGGLARIRGDGTVDPAFLPALGLLPRVTSLARDGTRLFITGLFGSVGGAPRSGLAAVDASSGAVTPWVPAVSGRRAIVAAGRLIVIGGTGSLSVGATALDLTSGAIIWQRTLGRDSIKPLSAYSVVNDVITIGNRVVVGGRFGQSSGFGFPTCVGTVAWLDATTGTIDATWAPSTTDCGEVMALATGGGTLYVGGLFSRLGGQSRTNIAAVNLTTGAVTAWAPQTNAAVTALTVSAAGSIYIGGRFSTVSGQPREGLAEFDASQTLTAWKANAYPQVVHDLVSTDGGTVIIGSSSAVSGGAERRNLAAFDLSTGSLLDWQPSADAGVVAMASGNGTVFVAGSFESVSGTARRSLAAIDATSAKVLPWNPSSPIPLSIRALLVHDEYVYLSGFFPSNLRRLHRVTGMLDPAWVPMPNGAPKTMLAHEGRLYINTFTGLAAFDLSSGQPLPWAPAVAGGSISALARADMTLFVAGTFTSIAGQARANLAAFDLRTGLLTPWAPETDGDVTALAVADRVVVAGGIFTTLAGQPRNGLGAVTFAGAPTPWSPEHRAPSALVVGADELTAVGNAAAPLPFLSDISTFALSGAPRPSDLGATVAETVVSLTWTPPVGVTPIGYRIEAGARPGISNLGTFVVGGTTTRVSTVAPNGTYFVRVRALLVESEPASDPSNEVVVTVGCTMPPLPPTGLVAQMNGAHVTLRWTASSPAARHVLELGSTMGAADLAAIPIPAGQEVFEADAPIGTYFARVRAVNACGASGPSAGIMFTVGANVPLPGAPTGLSAVVNGGIVTLSWTPPPGPIVGYVIEAGSAAGLADLATISIGATPLLQVPGVPPGTYFMRVRAITAAGVGPPSADIIVTP